MRRLPILILLCLSTLAQAAGTIVIVVGAGGESEYEQAFSKWADRWSAAAQIASMRVVDIGRSVQPATLPSSTTSPSTSPTDDKQQLLSILQSESIEQNSPLWIVLIGHGTSDSREAKFNLRGQDLSDKELAESLRKARRPIAIINCFSASGPFLNRLAGPDRIVITAAKTGSEFQYSRFGDYLSSSIADPTADLDKDGQTSLLEGFIAASHRTEEFYKQNGRLATEHALLDDNGDGLGVSADWFQGIRAIRSARTGAPVDGPAANKWFLMPSKSNQSLNENLLKRRDDIERAIEALRQKKTSLSESDYYAQLEKLLIDLARVYEENEQSRSSTQPIAK